MELAIVVMSQTLIQTIDNSVNQLHCYLHWETNEFDYSEDFNKCHFCQKIKMSKVEIYRVICCTG